MGSGYAATVLLRFSLYGFLKNQRYFEPFLVLAFLEKGLTFFEIGALIALRELATNILEIPSGAAADLWGRRRALMLSFSAYVVSFLVFGFAGSAVMFIPAMLLFSVGEAFRTGTHKAMIFAWLKEEGRTDEKTAVYGYTRSWSKLGSAASVVIGAGCVFWLETYSVVFLLASIPSALNIVNFLGYPASLDGERQGAASPRAVLTHTRDAVRDGLSRAPLRRLMLETMGFEGLFRASKDYLQPLLAVVAISALGPLAGGDLTDIQRTTLLIGPVYFALHLASSVASRRAHRVVSAAGSEEAAARRIWLVSGGLFSILALSQAIGFPAASVVVFVLLHVLQNVWRPILISRFDTHGSDRHAATTLSIESQAQRLAAVVIAPALGLLIDATTGPGGADWSGGPLWPIGVLGMLIAAAALRRRDTSEA
ncbi:MAG: MFS family permease [Myxococcota bacterium]|jgi:MFS family permease